LLKWGAIILEIVIFPYTMYSRKYYVKYPFSNITLSVLKMKIWIYWSESNLWIYFYIVLNKNWKIYWSEQSFTGLGPEYRCSSWGLPFRSGYTIVPFFSVRKDFRFRLLLNCHTRECPPSYMATYSLQKVWPYKRGGGVGWLLYLHDSHHTCLLVESWSLDISV